MSHLLGLVSNIKVIYVFLQEATKCITCIAADRETHSPG